MTTLAHRFLCRRRPRLRVVSAESRRTHPVAVEYTNGVAVVGEIILYDEWNALRPDQRPERAVLVPGVGFLYAQCYLSGVVEGTAAWSDFEAARDAAAAEREMLFPD